MSQIIATTLSNGSVSVPTATVVNGSAKAWVNFNGTGTIAIRDSFNVSSLTDNSTGNYTYNFTSAFGSANYAWSISGGVTGYLMDYSSADRATTNLRIRNGSGVWNGSSFVDIDATFAVSTIHGDLA